MPLDDLMRCWKDHLAHVLGRKRRGLGLIRGDAGALPFLAMHAGTNPQGLPGRAGLDGRRPFNRRINLQVSRGAGCCLGLDSACRNPPAPQEKKVARCGKPAYKGNP